MQVPGSAARFTLKSQTAGNVKVLKFFSVWQLVIDQPAIFYV